MTIIISQSWKVMNLGAAKLGGSSSGSYEVAGSRCLLTWLWAAGLSSSAHGLLQGAAFDGTSPSTGRDHGES